jgi:hypothetical protein
MRNLSRDLKAPRKDATVLDIPTLYSGLKSFPEELKRPGTIFILPSLPRDLKAPRKDATALTSPTLYSRLNSIREALERPVIKSMLRLQRYINAPRKDATVLTEPTVESLSEELERLVLEKVIPLLRRDVQVTSLWMKGRNPLLHAHVYEFGLGDKNPASPDSNYFFVLPNEHRHCERYVKGRSSDLLTFPMSARDKAVLSSFKQAFLLLFSLHKEPLVFKYVRSNHDSP